MLNSDWVIANRGLVWDLDVWPDDIPNDDPEARDAGIDYDMLNKLMLSSYRLLNGSAMIHVAGFTPWYFKYITSAHDGVATEWQTAKILSAYNAFIDADACCELNTFSNAAFYQHYNLKPYYKQNPDPTIQDMKDKGFIDNDGNVAKKNFMRLVYDFVRLTGSASFTHHYIIIIIIMPYVLVAAFMSVITTVLRGRSML